MTAPSLTDLDLQIRLFVYTFWIDHQKPPSCLDTAQYFHLTEDEVRKSYQRLHTFHTLFLDPGTENIRIANPLSAVPTDFRVHINDKSYWANCAWDSLGIPAMLNTDATINVTLRQDGTQVTYRIINGELVAEPAFVHFPLPFRQWYDDLIDT